MGPRGLSMTASKAKPRTSTQAAILLCALKAGITTHRQPGGARNAQLDVTR
jgi:hypothetical protein